MALELPAYGSVFVIFRRVPTAKRFLSSPPRRAVEPAVLTVDGPWRLNFPPDLGAPESAVLSSLKSWTESEDPGIKYFSGTAGYEADFEVDKSLLGEKAGFLLDLGALGEVAEVRLNGHDLGILWKEPFQVDISEVLRPGRNTLEVKVTNLWHNRLMGDLANPGQKPFARTNMILKAQDLIPSGLFGPVTIRRAAAAAAKASREAFD
ncbi:MAG: hypothetical protein FJY80_07000 [Candidatus Aminicenantes bacterium]|nr:hypothetical protein [Candidatus Aminicenantes bacterium]